MFSSVKICEQVPPKIEQLNVSKNKYINLVLRPLGLLNLSNYFEYGVFYFLYYIFTNTGSKII